MSPATYWRLAAYYFFYFGFLGVYAPYFALYFQSLGFGAFEIALLLSVMQVMRLIAPNLWGWLVARTGRRLRIMQGSALASGLIFMGLFGVSHYMAVLMCMVLMAFFWSAALPLAETLVLAHLADSPGRYAQIRLWGSIGFIVMVLVGGSVLEHHGPRAVLWLGVTILLGTWVVACILEEAPVAPARIASQSRLREVLKKSSVRRFFLACFCMSLAHGPLYAFYSIWLQSRGMKEALIGGMWTLGVLAEITAFLLMPRLLKRMDASDCQKNALTVASIRFLMIGWGAAWMPILILAQLLHGITFGVHHAAAIGQINHWFSGPLAERGQALYGSVSSGAGGLVGGLLAGWLWDKTGGAWVFTLAAACACMGAWLLRSAQEGETN